MDLKLQGKTVIVTGATAASDWKLPGHFQRKVRLSPFRVAHRRNSKRQSPISWHPRSRRQRRAGRSGQEAGAAALVAAVPQIDVLVNNLGIYEPKSFQDISDAEWRHMFEVNVMSGCGFLAPTCSACLLAIGAASSSSPANPA